MSLNYQGNVELLKKHECQINFQSILYGMQNYEVKTVA